VQKGASGPLTGSEEGDLANVISTFAAQAKLMLDHDRLSAYLVTTDGRAVERFAVATSPPLPGEGVIVPYSEFGLRHILVTNRALVSEDLASDSRIVGREDRVIAQAGFHGLLSVPLRLGGKPFGVLNFVSRTAGFYRDQDAPVAQQIADQVAIFFDHLRRQRDERAWTRHAVSEHERARLVRELHDTVAWTMPQIADGAARLAADIRDSDPDAAERATALARSTESALVDIRRAIFDLVPTAIDSRSIEETIGSELTTLRETPGVETSFQFAGDSSRLSSGVRRGVYRIFQEALSNIHRHAHAKHVTVALNIDGSLRLTIEDDGVGFDSAATARGGLGVRFMCERAQSLGSRLRIDSAEGQGTSLTLEVADIHEPEERTHPGEPVAEQDASTGVMLRVFIIESHPLLLAGVTHVLGRGAGIRVVGQAARAVDAHGQIARLRPDIVLLDVDDNIEQAQSLTREIKLASPTTSIIGMSDVHTNVVQRLTEHGVSGVIAKHLAGPGLIEAIRAVAEGARVENGFAQPGYSPVARYQLSSRERAILALIATGQTNAEIAATLFLATKTVERHVGTTVRKLQARNRAHAAALAVARGIVTLSD
jgi:signal transduction histidine kinase/DNA-binding NarL/FixJ family response regulator